MSQLKILGTVAVLLCLSTAACGNCTYDALSTLGIPPGMLTNMSATTILTDSDQIMVYCNDTSMITDLGRYIYITCNNGTLEGAPNPWPSCRSPANCSLSSPPSPPPVTGLSPTNSTVLLEGDIAEYYCTNPWFLVNRKFPKFEIACGLNGEFPNVTWPNCLNPIPPPPQCQCVGDESMPENVTRYLLNNFCRDPASPGYLNPPSKKRCGTRDIQNPTAENFCYCDSLETAATTSFWFTLRLLTEPWEWLLDKDGNSYLLQPTSAVYAETMKSIEQAIDDWILGSGIATGFAQSAVANFSRGAEVPNGIFPKIKPTTTTPKPSTTTTTTTTTTVAGGTTTGASTVAPSGTPSTTPAGTTTTTDTTTASSVARKKRQTTLTSGYTYINVLMVAQFSNISTVTLGDFENFYASLGQNASGILSKNIKIDLACPKSICAVQNMSYTCSNNYLEALTSDFIVETKYGTFGSTNYPTNNSLEVGDLVQLTCKQSLGPIKYPLLDNWDSDPKDHTLITYCTYPLIPKTNPRFALEVPGAPPCTPICTGWFPKPAAETNLALVDVIPVADASKEVPAGNFTWDANFFLFAGDRLKYQCIDNKTTVYGGVNKSTTIFGCTNEGIYDTPTTTQDWPPCEPEINIVISGVQLTLYLYDKNISERFKLISYHDEDNMEQVKLPANFFTTVTIPVFIGLLIFVFLCCLCTSPGSPICVVCDSKE